MSNSQKEKAKAASKAWKLANKEKVKEYQKSLVVSGYTRRQAAKWRINNLEQFKKTRRDWVRNNSKKVQESVIAWKKRNPEKYKAQVKRNRDKKRLIELGLMTFGLETKLLK